MLVMVNQIAIGAMQITVLNFSQEEVTGPVISPQLPARGVVVDLATGDEVGTVDALGTFQVTLAGLAAGLLVQEAPAETE